MEIRIPSVGESVFEALVAKWLRQDGDAVRKDEPVCEIETDKITMELNAEVGGILSIAVPEGTTVKIGTVIGAIREGSAVAASEPPAPERAEAAVPAGEPPLSPSVRKIARERGIPAERVPGTGRGGRVTVDDLFSFAEKREQGTTSPAPAQSVAPSPAAPLPPAQQPRPAAEQSRQAEPPEADRTTRTPMTPIRKRIAERLMAARQQTAMLTTFNEADLGRIVELRSRHKEQFARRHGVSLGFMSFFVKACVEALKAFPMVNARIDGNDIVRHHYYNIGIAIGADKGLVVPVLRDADRLHFWEIEQAIADFVEKIRTNRLELSDLEGGTFSISNGGVYGSLLSTPILNPPQSGVLGMHAIQDRPVARDGQVVIRPMMYLALSYDHRIIDGREAVGFLRTVKEYVEDPEELFLEG